MAILLNPISMIQPPNLTPKPETATVANTVKEFGQFLSEALGNVEEAQKGAATAAQRLATGEIKDVSEVMIASEKASLSLQLTVQVRNKVLEAYQEIMRMPV
jgi:flagellar hook-basal body complex protein FliE